MTGLRHDEGPDVGGAYGPYVQSERREIYHEYAKKLIELGGAYYCFCPKELITQAREKHDMVKDGSFKYDDPCRNLTNEEAKIRIANGESYVIRQKIPQSGTTTFDDAVYGSITVENNSLDENVLLKSDGLPTYNFANVIDDHLMKISHVMRGVEYLSSAPKYNLLYQAFGWEIPIYIHLPHIIKEGGKKLSKREGDAAFEDFCRKGYLIEALINYIALLGWNPGTQQEIFSLKELEEEFDIEGISKSSATFDIKKLNWMNGEYIRKMTLEEFHNMAIPYCREIIKNDKIQLEKVTKLLQARTDVFNEIPETIDFFECLPDYDINLYIHKKMKTDVKNSLENLKIAYDALKCMENWNEENLNFTLKELVEKMGIKNGMMLWPVRTALSGKQVTPGGAIEIADILGREESLRRIKIGIEKLSISTVLP